MTPRTRLPLRRWSSNLLCGLSLLIFLLAMGIWVRSYFAGESIDRTNVWTDSTQQPAIANMRVYWLAWARGTIAIWRQAGTPRSVKPGWYHNHWPPTRSLIRENTPGDQMNIRLGQFQIYRWAASYKWGWESEHRVVLPLWLFGLFAIPPVLWVRRWRRGTGGRGFPVQVVEAAVT